MKKESKKTLRTFGIASFLNDFGSDMIFPIWPIFLTTVLGANMTILGLIDGVSEAVVSISQAVAGYASDRLRKRKIFIWIGYLFAGVARLGYTFSATWQQIIPFRVLDRVGKIRGAPRDAMIADFSDHTNRGRNFGFLRTLDNLGAVFGIIFCIAFVETIGYRNLFLIASIPSLIGAFLILTTVREQDGLGEKLYKGLRLRDLNDNFQLFLLLSAIFSLSAFSYSFLLIFANQFGFSLGLVPVLYLIFTITASAVSLPSGRFADQFGRKPVLIATLLLWAICCGVFIVFKSWVGIIVAFVLYGIHKGALDTVQKTFVAELAPDKYRASGLGGFQMIIGICALPASFFAGVLWDTWGINAPFYFSMALTLVSIILLLFVREGKKSQLLFKSSTKEG